MKIGESLFNLGSFVITLTQQKQQKVIQPPNKNVNINSYNFIFFLIKFPSPLLYLGLCLLYIENVCDWATTGAP